MVDETYSGARLESAVRRAAHSCWAVFFFLLAILPSIGLAQTSQQSKPTGSNPTPEAATPAILAAFDKYHVVAMPEGHRLKDVDDFVLSLIRNPAFPEKVNDIAVECGNSLYQPILDRYIAGEDVPFTEVRKVWRNTTVTMCGMSGFFEQLFPLVRAINQKLPAGKRVRVLAGDPPIDWDQVKNSQDAGVFLSKRDVSIASVMEKEVLSKHRKALMLFGTGHIMHGFDLSAVSMYEKDYPNVTFVIGDLGIFDTDLPTLSSSPFAAWPNPSLARINGTWLGALHLDHFIPPPTLIDKDCIVHSEFPERLQKSMEDFVDAFLYVGPQDLRLWEQTPADIALDADYMKELQNRESLQALPGVTVPSQSELNQEIVDGARNPMFVIPKPPNMKPFVQTCLEHQSHSKSPQ